MATHFERQLEELHVQIITMGSLCEKVISLSNRAIRGDKCIQEIFDTDKEIDTKEREIENLCMRILLHQQPVARDLREVSAALKMISDMERIGDQASDIADLSKFIEENHVQIPELIGKMAEMTVGMVTESVDAFVKRDLDLCRKVIDDDDQVDDAFNQIKELQTARSILLWTWLLSVSRSVWCATIRTGTIIMISFPPLSRACEAPTQMRQSIIWQKCSMQEKM